MSKRESCGYCISLELKFGVSISKILLLKFFYAFFFNNNINGKGCPGKSKCSTQVIFLHTYP